MVERLVPELNPDDERQVADYMAALASSTLASLPEPASAETLWVRAHLVERWKAERRAQRPLDAFESVHVGLGLVAAAVLLFWAAPLLSHTLNFIRP